jgi:hypothetical protein
MTTTSSPYRTLAWVWAGSRIFGGTKEVRLDKSAAVGSAHVVVLFRLFRQLVYTPCHLHIQESQQNQGLERRRSQREFCR